MNQYLKPDWNEGGRVHNWRNYVNEDLRFIWDTFSNTQKTIIGKNAQEAADREEWD